MIKNPWERKGTRQCELCGKGFSQLYSDKKAGKFISGACWGCLYK